MRSLIVLGAVTAVGALGTMGWLLREATNEAMRQRHKVGMLEDQVARQETQIDRLTSLGKGMAFFLANDLVVGRTAHSFTGSIPGIRALETWRNENLSRMGEMLTAWRGRHERTIEAIKVPEPYPFSPDGLDEVARLTMEYETPEGITL